MKDFEVALRVAAIAHSGQTYGVEPYFERHVLDVVARVQFETDDEIAHTVAALHDIVEDTPLTLDNLAFFGVRVQRAVDALTRRPGETYHAYIDRVVCDDVALLVKRADLLANLNADTPPRIAQRNRAALGLLHGSTTCEGYDANPHDFD